MWRINFSVWQQLITSHRNMPILRMFTTVSTFSQDSKSRLIEFVWSFLFSSSIVSSISHSHLSQVLLSLSMEFYGRHFWQSTKKKWELIGDQCLIRSAEVVNNFQREREKNVNVGTIKLITSIFDCYYYYRVPRTRTLESFSTYSVNKIYYRSVFSSVAFPCW